MKKEDTIREMYRSYIELWACSSTVKKADRDVLYGAILAYGRVLEYKGTKIHRDMDLAKQKYLRTTYS